MRDNLGQDPLGGGGDHGATVVGVGLARHADKRTNICAATATSRVKTACYFQVNGAGYGCYEHAEMRAHPGIRGAK